MVDLRERNPGPADELLHGCRMGDCLLRVGVERFDQDAHAAPRQARAHEGLCVGQRQEASLDAHPPRDEMCAQLGDSRLPLVRRHKLGQHRPARHQLEAPNRVGLDGRRCAEGHGNSRTGRPNRPQRCRARLGSQRFPACRVIRVEVENLGAGVDRGTPLFGKITRRSRCAEMVARAVERGFEQR